MYLCFELSMPSVASWNGKWSGEDNYYAIVKNVKTNTLSEPDYGYNFEDGWYAQVSVKEITSKEATKIRKKAQGFCDYDWMVDSLLRYGKILNSLQSKQMENTHE